MRSISLELIQYQNEDKFPVQLNTILEHIYDEIDRKEYKDNSDLMKRCKSLEKIETLIRDRFNMTVLFDRQLHSYVAAAIMPFMSDYLVESSSLKNFSSSLLADLFSGVNIFKHINKLSKEKEEHFKKIHNRKGYVDRKNARVGGYLSEVKNYLIINFYTLKGLGVTPSELTSIILHELGHAFVGLESHYRLSTTNNTIMDILDNINQNKTDKAKYIFKRHFDEKDLQKASLGSNEEITDFYGKLAGSYIERLDSHFLNGKYDQTNYENLADSFAVRFGYGKDIVSGLNKLHQHSGELVPNTKAMFATLLSIELLSYSLMFVLAGLPGVVFGVFMTLVVHQVEVESHMTYDFPIDRYTRIKNGVINNLKNRNLPSYVVKDLIDQYMFIDDVIQKSLYFKGIIPMLSDYIIPNNRSKAKTIEVQRIIENSLNNDLFLKSALVSQV